MLEIGIGYWIAAAAMHAITKRKPKHHGNELLKQAYLDAAESMRKHAQE